MKRQVVVNRSVWRLSNARARCGEERAQLDLPLISERAGELLAAAPGNVLVSGR
jgi:hypothetical protein